MGPATTLFYLVISIGVFVAGVFVMKRIFDLKTISEHLQKHTEMAARQDRILTAQMELLASIAEKAGVPLKDINDVTSEFGVTFME